MRKYFIQRNLKGQFLKGVSSWNKGQNTHKRYYCKCGKEISRKAINCGSCAKTGKLNPIFGMKRNLYGKNNPNFGNGDKIKGKNNPNWKNGITPLHFLIRILPENKEWIRKVFERDDYICQECGQIGGKLEAHHKKGFNKIFKEFLKEYDQFSPIEDKETLIRLAMKYQPFWEITNGKTLCEDCHKNIKQIEKSIEEEKSKKRGK